MGTKEQTTAETLSAMLTQALFLFAGPLVPKATMEKARAGMERGRQMRETPHVNSVHKENKSGSEESAYRNSGVVLHRRRQASGEHYRADDSKDVECDADASIVPVVLRKTFARDGTA